MGRDFAFKARHDDHDIELPFSICRWNKLIPDSEHLTFTQLQHKIISICKEDDGSQKWSTDKIEYLAVLLYVLHYCKYDDEVYMYYD